MFGSDISNEPKENVLVVQYRDRVATTSCKLPRYTITCLHELGVSIELQKVSQGFISTLLLRLLLIHDVLWMQFCNTLPKYTLSHICFDRYDHIMHKL